MTEPGGAAARPMELDELLAELSRKGVNVSVDGERLLVRAPDGVVTPALREALTLHKQTLLRRGSAPEDELARIAPADRTGPLPLSFAQQRLWFLDQLGAGVAFNVPWALRLRGRLDVGALEASLNEILRRHEALRTTFTVVDGRALQVIAPQVRVALPVVDLRGAATTELEDRAERARRLAAEEALRPFDLDRGPLLRATLTRLGDAEHVLILNIHHIVFDGWSVGVFTNELAAHYAAFLAGRRSSLPDPPVQYADFAQWQRRWLQGETLERQLGYWKERLGGAPLQLELPADHRRPAVQTFRGAAHSFVFPAGLVEALRKLGQRDGATLFMVLLAGFKALLHRYTGQADIVVGSPVANRSRAELEGLIGFFVNTLAMRTDLSGDPTFRDLLVRVRDVAHGALEHEDLPFERVVDELNLLRDASRNPLFQVAFALQNAPRGVFDLPGLTVSPFETEASVTRFDLEFHLFESEDRRNLTAHLLYASDLFDARTVERLGRHYVTLLEGAASRPSARLSELPLLTEEESRKVVLEWNATGREYARELGIAQVFEAQARRTPEAEAVVAGGERLTYGELDRRSNQLARHLRRLGVGPEVRVGICLERSVEMVVGLLGVLKAGGAYVPLDPGYPPERRAFVLEDSAVPVLLTRDGLHSKLPGHDARILCLDRDWPEVAKESTEHLTSAATGDNLAYVIYTSGSTGTPKGVAVPHRGLANLVSWHRRCYDVGPESRATLVASPAFDASVWEVWPYLAAGASVHVPDEETRLVPGRLLEWLAVERITHCFLPTPLAEAVLREPEVERLGLRWLLTGGDKLHRPDRDRLPFVLVNHYGPTENTVVATCGDVDLRAQGDPPIGRPIANTRAYVLDSSGNPMPVGVPGELYVGGDGLARGYLGHPERTAEKFVPDVFAAEPGGRLYRTGDLVRYREDGNVEFLGRQDDQVKVRGFRIEPGEIESLLGAHPAVRESVVVAREDHPGEIRLAAYVTPRDGQVLETGDLRRYLKGKLPEHMVPSAFVTLGSLPLSPNGKVDRRALPAPDSRPQEGQAVVPPRNDVESTIAAIWREVLHLDEVGVHDSFFQLGGDSILSIQVLARARQGGLRLSLKQLINHQTIAELAAVAGTAQQVEAEQGLVLGPVPLTPVQRWFFERPLEDANHFNQAMLLELRRPVDPEALERALREFESHHDALRLRYRRDGAEWSQEIVPPAEPSLLRFDLAGLPDGEQVRAIAAKAAELQGSLDIVHGPLWRAALWEMGSGRTARLLIVIHHLAVDGVSWRILIDDLQVACEQAQRGEAIRLPAKTTSFRQWAERLESHGRDLRDEIEYWRSVGEGAMSRLPLDQALPDEGNVVGASATTTLRIGAEETRALLHDVPARHQTSAAEVLLAALAHALDDGGEEGDLLVDMEGHGREPLFEGVDLSRTVGWFTTIYPIRVRRDYDRGPAAALAAVKAELSRVPHRGIGYGVLRYLDGDAGARLSRLPEAQVSFNYLGQFDQVLGSASAFRLAGEDAGPLRGPRVRRRYLLELNALVVGGRLRVDLTYCPRAQHRSRIEALVGRFEAALLSIIKHCCSPDGPLAVDVAGTELSARDLDTLIAGLSEPGSGAP